MHQPPGLRRFKNILKNSNKIVITTHIHPDADGIGSQIALCLALRKMGKEAICINEKSLPSRYTYLDSQGLIQSINDAPSNSKKNIDLTIIVDTHSLNRIGASVETLAKASKNYFIIDHHPASVEITKNHCVETYCSATGELVGIIIKYLGINYTQEMALALYTAILIDTSSFRYPTVSGQTHQIISELLNTGVRPAMAYNYIYGTKTINHMRFLGEILSQAQTTEDEQVAWIKVTLDQMTKYGSHEEDSFAFINHLLILHDIKVVCMFRERYDDIKISLRSVGQIDVGLIAKLMGGGGHIHSAAFTKEGPMDKVIKEVIAAIQKQLQ